jgi:FAD-dependent oxidoreductase domain-containing protein 1
LLDLDALQRVFPSVGTDQVAPACHSPNDVWIDPQAAMLAFRHKAEQLGVQYIQESVSGLECSGKRVNSAILESGSRVRADHFVNTAGTWVGEIAAMTGARLPVVPMCRVQHYWLAEDEIEPLPLVKNATGAFFRPAGAGFVGGCPSFKIEPGFIRDIDRGYFADYFERTVWPLLADMVPKFESIKLQRQWSGHYAQNQLNGNWNCLESLK